MHTFCTFAHVLSYRRGNTVLLEQLIQNGGDINLEAHHKMTPLHIAGWFGHREVVKLLINLGELCNSRIFGIDGKEILLKFSQKYDCQIIILGLFQITK